MGFYPLLLDLKDAECLVVGGGRVAERKVVTLLERQARVRVVAPECTGTLQHIAQDGRIDIESRAFRKEDLQDADVVFGATGDHSLNREISRICREKKIPVNIVDDPDLCSFYVPSTLRRGRLTVSVATEGRSPALAKRLREEMEKIIPEELGDLLECIGKLRDVLKLRLPAADSEKFWEEFFASGSLLLPADVRALIVRAQEALRDLSHPDDHLIEGQEDGEQHKADHETHCADKQRLEEVEEGLQSINHLRIVEG